MFFYVSIWNDLIMGIDVNTTMFFGWVIEYDALVTYLNWDGHLHFPADIDDMLEDPSENIPMPEGIPHGFLFGSCPFFHADTPVSDRMFYLGYESGVFNMHDIAFMHTIESHPGWDRLIKLAMEVGVPPSHKPAIHCQAYIS